MREDEQPQRHRYFVAHVAQISRGYAQASAVNSTDLFWSRLVRDQEVDGSNPFAPTTSFRTNNLQHAKERKTAWCKTRRSAVQFDSRPTALNPPFSWSWSRLLPIIQLKK